MANAKPVKIGGTKFGTKTKASRYIGKIIDGTENGSKITGSNAVFVAELFRRHHEYEARTKGCEVSHFTVARAKGGSRCFYAVFNCGRMEDFSYKKCLC